MTEPKRVLVVAHKTAATPALMDAVRERAQKGDAAFTLLIPKAVHGITRVADPEDAPDDETRDILELALPLLEEAAGGRVEGLVGSSTPIEAIQDAINLHGFDEIIISTLSPRVSRWLHMDVPRRLQVLGLPITTVTAKGARSAQPA
ncbi:MAG TPA: hypothetical protein VGW10_07075 [Solirubrobacteraceae bacterium]|nr:hypothetical protein [Solirubrobacteraceae bacterium]